MSNLKLHFRCDNITNGNNVTDYSGNHNTGLLKGAIDLVIQPPLGACYRFNGGGQHIEVKPANKVGLRHSSFTAMAWVRAIDLHNDRSIFGTDSKVDNKGLHLIFRDAKVHFGFYGNDITSTTTLSTKKWYHLCWRYDKAKKEKTIFINGHLDISHANSEPFTGTGTLKIGRWGGGHYFNGTMTGIRIYNQALSVSEIQKRMLDDYSSLRLHFRLDEYLDKGSYPDSSSGGHIGRIQPNNSSPVLLPDDRFGSATSFDGNTTIEIPYQEDMNITGDLCISAWVWVEKGQNDWVRIVGSGENRADWSYGLWYHFSQKKWYFQISDGQHCQYINAIALKRWYHLSGVRFGDKLYLYLDGKKVSEVSGLTQLTPVNQLPLLIGGIKAYSLHQGRIANVRLYDRALSEKELAEIQLEDQSALASFRKTHPIDFKLYNDQDQPILYLDNNPAGQELQLEIENYSKRPLALENIGDTASATNYHFELRFRPSTIAAASQNEIFLAKGVNAFSEVPNHWSVHPASHPDGTFSLYLLRKPNGPANQKVILHVKDKFNFSFQKVRADGFTGTRGTNVTLAYHNLTYSSGQQAQGNIELVQGHCLQHLQVVNHLGKEIIPFHLGFVGNNVVLNDTINAPNGSNLHLQFTNTLKQDLRRPHESTLYLTGSSEDPDKATTLRIYFDVSDDNNDDRALVKTGSLADVEVDVSGNWGHQDGSMNPWVFVLRDSMELAANQGFEFKIENIKSSLPAGHANIYVDYEWVSGYREHTLVAVAEKSPLLYYRTRTKRENVGIGITAPEAKLAIAGGVHVGSAADPGNNNLWVDGKVGIGVIPSSDYHLSMHGYIRNLGSVCYANSDYKIDFLNDSRLNKLRLRELNVTGEILDSRNSNFKIDMPNESKLNMLNAQSLTTNILYAGKIHDKDDDRYFLNPNGYSYMNRMRLETGNAPALRLTNNAPHGSNGYWPTLWITNEGNSGALYIDKGFTVKPDGNSWDNPSDRRLKKNIEPYHEGLKQLNKIRPVWFRYNGEEGLRGQRQVGIIAQEMQKVAPYMISEFPGKKGVSYLKSNTSALIFMVVNAVQELSKQLSDSQQEIKKLRKQIAGTSHSSSPQK